MRACPGQLSDARSIPKDSSATGAQTAAASIESTESKDWHSDQGKFDSRLDQIRSTNCRPGGAHWAGDSSSWSSLPGAGVFDLRSDPFQTTATTAQNCSRSLHAVVHPPLVDPPSSSCPSTRKGTATLRMSDPHIHQIGDRRASSVGGVGRPNDPFRGRLDHRSARRRWMEAARLLGPASSFLLLAGEQHATACCCGCVVCPLGVHIRRGGPW